MSTNCQHRPQNAAISILSGLLASHMAGDIAYVVTHSLQTAFTWGGSTVVTITLGLLSIIRYVKSSS